MVSISSSVQLAAYSNAISRYMEKGRFDKAFNALCRLRKHKIQATRDMYYAYKLLEVEQSERAGRSLWKEFFTVRRNRRAAQSSFFVMFMQQFCGVNVIAYYSKFMFLFKIGVIRNLT
jgi:pentatricopeptide repeat protein